MDTADIQPRIDAVNKIASAKGLKDARVQFTVEAHKEHRTSVFWYGGRSGSEFHSWHSKASDAEDVLVQAEAWAEALPTLDERKFREFMNALGEVIDMGRANNIDVAFVNPLTETMKKISENALTFQKSAAE